MQQAWSKFGRIQCAAACVTGWFVAWSAAGQPFLVGDPVRIELTEPLLNEISGTTRARLEQIRVLIERSQWKDAVEALDTLSAEDSEHVVAVTNSKFLTLPAYCQLLISKWPPEGLAVYRRSADTLAETWYRDGIANRDSDLLGRVVDEAFCSSWGDDALFALGELALERGDYARARRCWQAMSPMLRAPNGQTAWAALYGIDIARQWPRIRTAWQQRSSPADWLAYPDTDLDLADVRARLVLVSIRAGELDRAALELDMFRKLHPEAVGRLAGQDVRFVDGLEQLMATAREWTETDPPTDWWTFAREPSRNGIATAIGPGERPAWAEAVKLPRIDTLILAGRASTTNVEMQTTRPLPLRESDLPLCYAPVIADERVYFSSERRIHAVDLATGTPAITTDGVIYQLDLRVINGTVHMSARDNIVSGSPKYSPTIADNILYARVGEDATGRVDANKARRDERIVGIDLRREGLLVFEVKPDDGTWSFDGAPVSNGRQVLVAMRQSDARPGASVASFDAATGRRQWRTYLGTADTPTAGRGDEITNNLLTLVEDRVYVNTNLGLVASLDAGTGRVHWLRRYDRVSGALNDNEPLHLDRDPSPCVYADGLLFVAPADTPKVLALDAETGATVWVTDRLSDVMHLLGVVEGHLIASGNRLWSLDACSGRVRFVWPESEHAGLRGFGRGVIAGREAFWPTREQIYVMDATTGRQTRRPIDISSFAGNGANLIAAEGRLLIVGQERMMAFGAPTARPERPADETVEAVAKRE